MQVSIKPWGNSQGIRFSREFLASAGIKPNDVLTAEVIDGKIVLSKQFQHRTLPQRSTGSSTSPGNTTGASRWETRCGNGFH